MLKTNDLKKMTVKELTQIANSYAAKLMAMYNLKQTENPRYKELGLELYHVSELIDVKKAKYQRGLLNIKKNKK